MFKLKPDHNELEGKSSSIQCCYGMPYASFTFGMVSVIAYSIWAFHLVPGRVPMYISIAIVYIGLSGFALSRLDIELGGISVEVGSGSEKFTLWQIVDECRTLQLPDARLELKLVAYI